ncbi:hypothetical protein SAMN02927914_06631, partial [Mesorhizobium qingshengii]
GDICRREVRIDKSEERLRDGDLGLSIGDGKKIMAALQNAVVTQEAETYALFRRVCPDCHTFRPVKDYTTRRIRTVFGAVEVRNPRWMLCRDCHPGIVDAFAPLKEICPDRVTPELMELTARLASTMPYRQAASILAKFLPIEPTETHATVRKRTIRVGERLDEQIAEEAWCARLQIDERRCGRPLLRHQQHRPTRDTGSNPSCSPARGVLRLWRCDGDFRRRRNPQAATPRDAEADHTHHRLVPHRHEGPADAADRRSYGSIPIGSL